MLFILAMLLLISGLILFLYEVRLAMRALASAARLAAGEKGGDEAAAASNWRGWR